MTRAGQGSTESRSVRLGRVSLRRSGLAELGALVALVATTLVVGMLAVPTVTPTPTPSPIPQPPIISAIADQFMDANTTKLVSFSVGHPDTPLSSLQAQATSGSQQIVPDASLVVTGATETRVLAITPLPNTGGFIKITITVTDPTGLSDSTSFMLTITQTCNPC